MLRLLSTGFLSVVLVSMSASAQERGDHYQGEVATDLPQALRLFSEYNQRLAVILEQESLEVQELISIHELTYTLENALETLQSELADLADTLETLHIASEQADFDGARSAGEAYLEKAALLAP